MKTKLLGFIPLLATLVISSVNFQINQEEINDPAGPAPMGEFTNDYKGEFLGEIKPNMASDDTIMPTKTIIHYQVDDGKYDDLRFWIWGGEYNPDREFEATGVDNYGMYLEIDMAPFKQHDFLGFLVLKTGDWSTKTQDAIINYEEFPPNKDGLLEIWCYPEQTLTISVFKTIEETMGGKILSADFLSFKKAHIVCTDNPVSYRLYGFTSHYYKYVPDARPFQKRKFLIADVKFDQKVMEFDINFPNTIPASMVFGLEVDFKDVTQGDKPNGEPIATRTKAKNISMAKLYKTKRFNQYYTYDGNDLGVTYTKEKSIFKLWAPTCASVNLKIYEGGNPKVYKEFKLYKMGYTLGGVWSCEVEGDLHGKYYTYACANSVGEVEVCDPYAKSSGINGIRGMILDFDKTDPEGWDDIPDVWDGKQGYDLKQPNDLSVYEVHIRDLTMHETWKGKKKAGTYGAFIEKGTTYSENGITVKTGFDHIEELGVNAVQILPFFDQQNDEEDKFMGNNKIDTPFNWGYNPQNYNIPEGVYSSDPYNGAVKVREIKEMVQAFANNANHTRVIMDVVYNHVASTSTSNFEKIMPGYYFRTTDKGVFFNASGCGNDVKTESKMMRKFIVDSVTWWASEYKIKGFRFDLMGLIDVNTMRAVKDAVYAIDPDNVCYGEGWPWVNEDYGINQANTDNVYSQLYPSKDSLGILGGFNDTFRDGVRGGNGWGLDKYPGNGWVNPDKNGVGDRAQSVADGVRGIHRGKGGNPYQTINYASCHDNFTLFDQLYWTLSPDNGVTEPDLNIVMETMIAIQSAVAFSNGIAFFHSGEELLRSKVDEDAPDVPGAAHSFSRMYGKKISHNSYISSDKTNAFDYSNKISVKYKGEDVDTQPYYAKYLKLIAERKNFTARHPYSEGNKETAAWFVKQNGYEGNPNGSTGFGVYWNYNDSEYWMFFSGCVATKLGFDAAHKTTCIYNSLDKDNTYTTANNEINLSPRQFLVFKANAK